MKNDNKKLFWHIFTPVFLLPHIFTVKSVNELKLAHTGRGQKK